MDEGFGRDPYAKSNRGPYNLNWVQRGLVWKRRLFLQGKAQSLILLVGNFRAYAYMPYAYTYIPKHWTLNLNMYVVHMCTHIMADSYHQGGQAEKMQVSRPDGRLRVYGLGFTH